MCFHLGRARPPVGGAKLRNRGHCGTSAGAMNAGVLADGLRCGGAARARVALRQYWEDIVGVYRTGSGSER
jgi:predicted acylesterase/phospholipase RssA